MEGGFISSSNPLINLNRCADKLPSTWNKALQTAIHDGSTSAAAEALRNGAEFGAIYETDWTCWHLAVLLDRPEIVAIMIKFSPDCGALFALQDTLGRTSLHWACLFGHRRCVQVLLEQTDCRAVIHQRDIAGLTPVMMLYESNNPIVVDAIMNIIYMYCDCDVKQCLDDDKRHHEAEHATTSPAASVDWTDALRKAVVVADGRAATKALDNGADLTAIDSGGDGPQRAALHLAAQHGHISMVELLIQHCFEESGEAVGTSISRGQARADRLLDLADNRGQTALHLAAHGNHSSVVQIIILTHSRPDDLFRMRDFHGQTALHLATHQGHANIVEMLLNPFVPVSV